MQMIAEIYGILRDGLGMSPKEIAPVFADWNKGRLNSYLIEITAKVLAADDPKTGKPVVEIILDRAGQKGTGKWSAIEAQQLGIPATAIEAAVAARVLSSLKDERHRRRKGLWQGRRHAVRRQEGGCARGPGTGTVCRQDRGLCAGLCRDVGRLARIRLEPAAADDRQDLARRLHHPLAVFGHARRSLFGTPRFPTFS